MDVNIQEIELGIEEAQKMVDKRDAIDRLMDNKDFRSIVVDGYMTDEAVRLAHISGDENLPDRGEIFLEIQAISKFRTFIRTLRQMGDVAEREIEEHQQALDEVQEMESIQ